MNMKKFKSGMAILSISALSLITITGCGTTKTISPLPPPAVKVQQVQLASMPTGEEFLGTVTPYMQTLVAPSLSGILSSVKVRVGDRVEAGQLLATLDTEILNSQLNQAQANKGLIEAQKNAGNQKLDSALKQAEAALNSAKTNLENAQAASEAAMTSSEGAVEAVETQLDNQVANAEKALAAARAQRNNAEAMYQNAVDMAERAVASAESNLRALEEQKGVLEANPETTTTELANINSAIIAARAVLNNAQAALEAAENSEVVDVAEAQVNQAEQVLENAKTGRKAELSKALASLEAAKTSANNQVKGAEAQLAQAQTFYDGILNDQQPLVNEAQLDVAKASFKTIQVQINKGRLTSPISGYVVTVNAQAGQAVGPQGGFIMIASMDPLLATVEVPESSIFAFKTGMDMTVAIPSSREEFAGKIDAIHPAPNMNKKYLVDIKIPAKNQNLLLGMRVEAYASNVGKKSILIPADSVVTLQSGAYSVFVVEDGVVHNQVVKVGSMAGNDYEIISGLTLGQELVIEGQNLLSDGDDVQVVD